MPSKIELRNLLCLRFPELLQSDPGLKSSTSYNVRETNRIHSCLILISLQKLQATIHHFPCLFCYLSQSVILTRTLITINVIAECLGRYLVIVVVVHT